ncbi:hypothetical protein [Lactobacillus kimbladii]|uniref:hypothetical protein n=1 Tax=Lactobacillus kimbladii TaxID=1218506 RepID=UPI003AF58CF9
MLVIIRKVMTLLSQARANVQAQCQDEFYQAFNVKEGDGMWLDPDKRVQVW